MSLAKFQLRRDPRRAVPKDDARAGWVSGLDTDLRERSTRGLRGWADSRGRGGRRRKFQGSVGRCGMLRI